jgi:peptide/nickel transport system permease protein
MQEQAVAISPGKQASETSGEKIYSASQWQLMWWRFTKHRLAVVSAAIVIVLYFVAAFCQFVAPYDPNEYWAKYALCPPQRVRFVDSEGRFSLRPFVYHKARERDPETLGWDYADDTSVKYPLRFFVRGTPYKLWGLFETDRHLVGVTEPDATMFLVGTDRLGRDVLTRVVYGAAPSMTIGLVGVTLTLFFGILLGGISGYMGGAVDLLIQRIIEILQSMPSVPLWMGLAAAVPPDWPVLRRYFMITVILSFIGWTGMARVVRGRFLSLRSEDFVLAARLAGSSELRIIFRHMLPSFLSHIIAVITLRIPGMILAETSLSFVGLGMRAPAVSWGVLLREAQNLRTVAQAPWNLATAVPLVLAILSFNFVGDGLRDAADPYGRG